jgi:hypothetical protein
MDITEGSAQRFELGIERFLAGQPITLSDVVFCKHPTGFLVISSFSEHIHVENSSPVEALQKIRWSKEVLHALTERSDAFASIADSLPHKYEFCHDYGMGTVLLASENDGQFKWCN